jgi:uncharacterized protein (TIGR02996 family)
MRWYCPAVDQLVAARKLLGELVKDEQIEVRRAEIVGRDLAKHIEALGRPPSGHELEAWLGEHTQVTELYASTSLLDELVFRYLTPPPPDVPVSESEQRHADLEREIRDALAAPEPYLVYADWLQERGDPFGELLALGVAATRSGAEEDQLRFERHRKLHEARFLDGVKLAGLAVTWRHGVMQSIEELVAVETIPLATWQKLFGLRVCGYLEALTLRRSCTADLDQLMHEAAPHTIRAVTLEGYQQWPAQLLHRGLESLAVAGNRLVLARDTLPATLARLDVAVHELVVEASLALPVRELHVVLSDGTLEALQQLKLPNVERLVLRSIQSPTKLLALLDELALPRLTHLAIGDGVFDAKTFGKLAKLPIAKQLTSLALTNLELSDELVHAMTRTKRTFAALAEVDLSFNELSREGLESARALAPSVLSRRQNRKGDGFEKRIRRWAGTRLTVAEEIADPRAWKRAGVDGDTRWARYRGDDEYELYITRDLGAFGCTCPSSYQPCKHVIALALLAERGQIPEAKSDGVETRVREQVEARRREIEEIVFALNQEQE